MNDNENYEIGSLVVYTIPYSISLSHSIGLILNLSYIEKKCLVLWSKPDLFGIEISWHNFNSLIVIRNSYHANLISKSRSGGLGHLK